jgi:hypothetical protein
MISIPACPGKIRTIASVSQKVHENLVDMHSGERFTRCSFESGLCRK